MKNLFFCLVFTIFGTFAFSQSSCACRTSDGGAVSANCPEGSSCWCNSQDGGCSCGCTKKEGNASFAIGSIANLKNTKFNNCGIMNEKFIIENTKLDLKQINNSGLNQNVRKMIKFKETVL